MFSSLLSACLLPIAPVPVPTFALPCPALALALPLPLSLPCPCPLSCLMPIAHVPAPALVCAALLPCPAPTIASAHDSIPALSWSVLLCSALLYPTLLYHCPCPCPALALSFPALLLPLTSVSTFCPALFHAFHYFPPSPSSCSTLPVPSILSSSMPFTLPCCSSCLTNRFALPPHCL